METHEQAINHWCAVNDMAKCLSSIEAQCVVIFITNHSHDLSGDLFVSPGSCATVTEVWLSHDQSEGHIDHMPQFMGALLPNAFATFLHGKEGLCGWCHVVPWSQAKKVIPNWQLTSSGKWLASLSLPVLKALIPYQTPCLRFNWIHCSSAPALSDSQLHPGLCTASFDGEVQCAQFHAKQRESTEGPDMCGFTPRLDLGATNFQFNVRVLVY